VPIAKKQASDRTVKPWEFLLSQRVPPRDRSEECGITLRTVISSMSRHEASRGPSLAAARACAWKNGPPYS